VNITPPYGYQEVVPLTKTHTVVLPADRKLPTLFRQLTAMPLSFTEFAFAMRDYPIAFISGDQGNSYVAMVLVGLTPQQNLFVAEDDSWDAHTYMPAYVRRYPFCMTRVSVDGNPRPERIACVEKRAVKARGEVLFDEQGNPTPVWESRQKLLFEFEADLARTEDMCRQLKALDLLEPFAAKAEPDGEEPITLTGINRVSEGKLHALPAETLKDLAQKGILSRVYTHLASLANFQRLLDRRSQRQTGSQKRSK